MAEETVNPPAPAVLSEPAVQSAPQVDRADKRAFITTTAIALVVYLFSLTPQVTLGWSGLMVTGAAYAGVPMPAGYPVWTIYSWLFTKLLPFSNLAWRVAVGSAVAGALACGLVALLVSFSAKVLFAESKLFQRLNLNEQGKLRLVCGSVAGLVLGFSTPIWGDAVIPDFWSLGLLLFTGALYLFSRACFEPERRRFLCTAFFLFGMLLTNNQEWLVALPGFVCLVMLGDLRLGRDVALIALPWAVLFTAANQYHIFPWFVEDRPWIWPLPVAFVAAMLIAFVAAIRTREFGSRWKLAMACAFCLLLGLGFYLYLPIASISAPPVNHGYPRTFEGFFHVLSRGQFERVHPTDNLSTFVQQLWMFLKFTGKSFGWLYLVIALVPFCARGLIGQRGRRWLAGLVTVWICTGPLLLAMLNPSVDRQSIELTESFFNASRVILAVLMGLGLIILGAWLTRPREHE